MTKIAHLADIHIRGLRYLDEMEYTFNELYQSLDQEKPDLILIAGDIYHSKLTVTSEYFSCCSRLLRNLSNRAPIIMILGNHDLALQNLNRMDALTPIIEALGDTKFPIYFEKDLIQWNKGRSKNGKIFFHNFSILKKKEEWPNEELIINKLESGEFSEEDVHIALYHGSINESVVDSGWVSRGNEDNISIFKGFDFAMLGDIHRYQMLTPRIGYPGSLRQNNFGESREKGYLLWKIDSKEDYSVKRIVLPQKRYFYTIEIDSADSIPENLEIKKGCRIRVKLNKRINISDDLKIRETIKRLYKPCNDVTTSLPKDAIKIEDLQVGAELVSQEDLRNKDVQKRLIIDFFKNENLDKDLLETICKLDEKYNSYLDHNVARNVIWKPKKIKWENIFSYGKGNYINFSKINGLIGVFGKNMVGKALSLETDIPTLDGWKKIKNIEVGDMVFAPSGKPTKVLAKSEIYNNHVCYKVIFSDGTEVIADADHLWDVEDHYSRNKNKNIKQTLTTRQLKKTLLWRKGGKVQGNGHEWSVDVCSPVRYEKKKLEIEPYVLGCWLGDGTSANGGFTCSDEEIIKNLRSLVGENIVKHNCKNNDIHYNIKKLIPKLRKLNVLNNKHIPTEYLQSNIEDRKLLLSGLLDTDGYCNQKGVVEFTNTNKLLAEQTYELITSLGYKATFKVKDAKLNGKFISKKYCIYFSPREYVFCLKRKNDRIKINGSSEVNRRFIIDIKKTKRELVQCLVVEDPSHLFLITKSFIPTHNSSIFDGLAYCAWSKINKEGANKNVDYINSRKKKCKYDMEFDFGGTDYFIQRSTTRAKSEKTAPVNDINFFKREKGKKVSLNGATKPETNVNIRNLLGGLDDFVATSLSPQEGLLAFLNTRGTDKKKLFAKFLDVNIFEQKYKEADKDFQDLKSQMKKYNNVNFHHLIQDCKKEIEETQKSLKEELINKEKTDKSLEELNDRIANLSSKMKDVDEDISLDEIEKSIVSNQLKIDKINERIIEIKSHKNRRIQLTDYLTSIGDNFKLIEAKLEVIAEVEKDLKRMKAESALLEKVPCDDQFPMCPFITKAHRAKGELRNFDESRLNAKTNLLKEKEEIESKMEELDILDAEVYEMSNLKLQLENLKLKQDSLLHRKKSIEKVQNAIKTNRDLINQIKDLKKKKDEFLQKVGHHSQAVMSLSKKYGQQEGELLQLIEKEAYAEELRSKFLAFSLYLKAMGKNGISYRIISSRLPLVNEEANRILSQVCDLSLLIEDNQEEKSIKLYIVGGDKGKRVVELGSGFEKTMVALSLRAALWSISSLPKTPVLILDEPFMFVEEGKFGATVRMLNYLKNYFEHIFIISHNETLKNIVDTSIYVTKGDDGFAYCKV